MKKSVSFILSIVGGVLAIISLVVVCLVAVVTLTASDNSPDVEVTPPGPVQTSSTTGQSFEEWTEEYFRTSRQAEEEAKKTPTTQTTTTAETTTTSRSWFTAYTGSVTVTSWTTTTTEPTTTTTTQTTTAMKTTRTLTQAEKDMVYSGVYEIMMEKHERDKAVRLEYIAKLDEEIARLEAQEQAITAQYEKDIDALYERFKHEFIPIASMEASLYNTYQNNIASINESIAALEAEKRSAQAELAQGEKGLDAVIQAKYYEAVEKLQQSTLS